MKRVVFLSLSSIIALTVGTFALLAPGVLLMTKGVSNNPTASVWVQEVGILLIALGISSFMVRNHEDSPTLYAFLVGNALIQIGLFPIEILAYLNGTIASLLGIVPNSIIHVGLASGFIYYSRKMSKQSLQAKSTSSRNLEF